MISFRNRALCALAFLPICGWNLANGQAAPRASAHVASAAAATPAATTLAEDTPAVPSRILQPIDETRLVRLTGNTHPDARAEFDKGLVDPQLPLERIQLVLKRSPEQEAALDKFMEEQQEPGSPNFHHWLTPEEFGRLYGPSDADIATVTNWLENHGFQIYLVTKGRTHVEFSGNAGQVSQTFHTEIHRYLVNGEEHVANDRDPQIPEALLPVITGIASLHNFFPVHQSILGDYVKRDRKTGKITPVNPPPTIRPLTTYTDGNNYIHEDISPWDFATIYNLKPLWAAGITGAGQSIAISAVTDIEQSDINTFRSSFDLPASTVDVIHNGTDPGFVSGAQVENTLDTEWSGAAAPEATVRLVVTASTTTTFGGVLSDSYIVDNKIAPVMSASYGSCEIALGTAGNASNNSIFQEGAAVGISIFESSGDQGSTGCDNSDAAAPNPAVYGLQVNGDASPPYVTAVGGTDFLWQTAPTIATYWNATNDPTTGATAKGYIREIPWDSTCTSSYLVVQNSFASAEALCNYVYVPGGAYEGLVRITGGSGGVSACTTSSNDVFSTCGGGYAKPSWQTGVGVDPTITKRELPDVSLFASDGYPDGLDGSAYLLCVASSSPNSSCDYTDPNYIIYQEVGGTSVSSPAMAGIMALVVQKMGAAQGLANPVFYKLAAKDNLTNCNSSTVGNGNSCIFYDVTSGTNAQVCTTGSRNCVTSTAGDALGVVTGYNTTTGYDLATGLGSVNAYNLVEAWSSAVTVTPTVTLTPTTLTFASTTVGATSVAQVVTLKNTSASTALAITTGGITFTGADISSYLKTTTCGTSLAAGASCTISVSLKPAATGTLTATLSVADNATGTPQKVTLTGTGAAAATKSITLSPATITFPNAVAAATSEAEPVTVKNTGTGAVTISSIALGGTNPSDFEELNTCPASLASGASCLVFVAFKPASAAAFKATLSVTDNATGSPQSVALSGTGTAAISVTLSTKTLTFASTAKGTQSATQSVTVTNAGTSTLAITGISITGVQAASFFELNDCGPTLAAGASCAIDVAFKPATTGSLAASLTIADNGSGSPQTVSLTGTGH